LSVIEKSAIEKYSKKWGVSEEEAERKIKRLLEEAGKEDRKGAIPTVENIFPQPLGEVSKKIQDVNQALLSTAYTRRLLNSPPEDVATLRDRIENLDRVVLDLKGAMENQIKQLTETLEDKKRKEVREELLQEVENKIDPLRKDLKTVLERLKSPAEGIGAGSVAEPAKVLDEAKRVAEKAKKWLSEMGYRVEPETLSKDQVQKMIEKAQKSALEKLPPEELKQRLEKAGYKIIGGPLSYEQVEKLIEEAARKAQEEVLEDQRIKAVENIIRDSVKQIVGMFSPAVKMWMEYSLTARGSGASSQEESSPSGESSA